MKTLTNITLAIVAIFSFTSCSDSKEKVLEDTVDASEELMEVLEAYEVGAVSESEAVEEIESLMEKGRDLEERMEKVMAKDERSRVEQFTEMTDEEQELMAEMLTIGNHIQRIIASLQKSGKWSPALEKAMDK